MAQRRTQRKATRTRRTTRARWKSGRERPRRGPDARRKKISTTVAAESYGFLQRLIEDGKANTLAEAVDLVLEEARRIENRRKLESATTQYFDSLSAEDLEDENELGEAISAGSEIEADE